MRYFIKAMQIMTIVSAWSAQALEDGRVTADEAYDLLKQVLGVLEIPMSFKVIDVDDDD